VTEPTTPNSVPEGGPDDSDLVADDGAALVADDADLAADLAADDGAAMVANDADFVDELPADLNITELSGDYMLPNNNRRRIPAAIYLVMAIASLILWITSADSSPLVNDGFLWIAIFLGAFAVYGLVAGRTLLVDETEALVTATATVGFPIGHASAQMVWRGWLSRPVWRLLAYSADNPPSQRAIIVVDGINGNVLEWFAEKNPEDWAQPASAAVGSDD